MKQRKYEPEFKERIVKEALETGNNSLIARKYSINPGVVCRWVRDSKKQPYKEIQAKALESYHSISEEPRDLDIALKQIHQLKAIIGKKELEIAVLTDLLKKTNTV